MEIKLSQVKIFNSKYVYLLRKKNTNNVSFLSKKYPNFKEHNEWFKNVIKDKKHKFYLIKIKKIPCGYIRLEKFNKEFTVSILIEKKFRKKGIATKALLLIENKIDIESILTAHVVLTNLASVEMFSKLGYKKITKLEDFYVMKKKLSKIKIINQIEKIRGKNNKTWMDILRLAYRNSPRECANLMSKIYKDDSKISKLVKKLIN